MVSVAEGLRMMQGGVDRTGFADMAEGLGNPGMDLIAARRAEAAQAEAMDEYERQQAERDAEYRDSIQELLEGLETPPDIYGTPITGVSGIDADTGKFAEQDPTFREKYLGPFFEFFGGLGGDDDFEIGDNTFAGGGLTRDEKDFQDKKNFGIGSLIEQAYESSMGILPYLYDILGVSGFDKGGSVSGRLSDEEKTLRLSGDDKFIQAENVGDTELYNYLVGGEIMPGLNFELGLMDDAVMEPGMMSPEDLKFFRLIKDF
tara:strand:- start:147 stop:926 length:780 start_codon:yes stop_codon:yes gene_type:complete